MWLNINSLPFFGIGNGEPAQAFFVSLLSLASSALTALCLTASTSFGSTRKSRWLGYTGILKVSG
ncbi:hypothetical protein D3C72_1986390 [compost metagenome]